MNSRLHHRFHDDRQPVVGNHAESHPGKSGRISSRRGKLYKKRSMVALHFLGYFCCTASVFYATLLLFSLVRSKESNGGENALSPREGHVKITVDENAASHFDHEDETDNGPKLAWLMSFPNSGTSYTLKMVREVSKTAAASNYGVESESVSSFGSSMPVYKGDYRGPFWIAPDGMDLPTNYVLTKTHCGGHCTACRYIKSVQNLHSFLVHCRSGTRRYLDELGSENTQFVTYGKDIVGKALHIFRNPFDNIVSRFHHYKSNFALDIEVSSTREGFRTYCSYYEGTWESKRDALQYIEPEVMMILEQVPCSTDFIRYAHWHDMAFLSTDELDIPTKIIYYENYSTKYDETVDEILDFLELEKKGSMPKFIKGKEYSNYFSKEERDLVKVALQALSSRRTWEHIHHYFE